MVVLHNTLVRTANGPRDKHIGVHTDQRALADFVRRVASEKGISLRQVARSGRISHVTVSDIVNGNRKDIKTDTLLALARGLDVTEQEILAASMGRPEKHGVDFEGSDFEALYKDLSNLSPEDQRELRPVLEMLRAEIRRRKSKTAPHHSNGGLS